MDILPIMAVGHGDSDLPHKVSMALHVAKLMAGVGPELFTWRCSFRGCCPDQGVERGIVDAPYVEDRDPAQCMALLQAWADGEVPMLATKPEAYLFPRCLLITGPCHVGWNAYKSAVIAQPSWDKELSILKAVMTILGQRGLRERFI